MARLSPAPQSLPFLPRPPSQHQPPALSMETRSPASQGLYTRASSPHGALHPSFRRSNPSLPSGLRWLSSPQGPETWLAASITCTHGASVCDQDASRLHCKLNRYSCLTAYPSMQDTGSGHGCIPANVHMGECKPGPCLQKKPKPPSTFHSRSTKNSVILMGPHRACQQRKAVLAKGCGHPVLFKSAVFAHDK